jgi:Xaa-Pro aminopeptidase
MHAWLKRTLGSPYADRLVPAEDVIMALWGHKIPEEVALIKQSGEIADRLMMEAFEAIKPGATTERDIFNLVRRRTLAMGLTPGWYEETSPIVRVRPRRGASAGAAVVQPGSIVSINAGVLTRGYANDLDRTAYVLRPGETSVPRDVQRMWDVTRTSVETAIRLMRPGAIGFDVDRQARKVVTDAGFKEYWYQTGHPVGIWVHDEGPYIGPRHPHYGRKVEMTLQKGDVFALEPGISMAVTELGNEQIGIHLQEMVVVTESGAEYLVPPQREIVLIRPEGGIAIG